MQYRAFANEIRRYNVETWYILQHRNPSSANTILPKNLPRWRADDIRPYERYEIFAAVIRWHRLRRVVRRAANQNPMIAGGDHTIIQRLSAARLFPLWGNNVGALRRQCNAEHFVMKFGGIKSKYGILETSDPRFGQYGSAQKFATLAGG